MWPGQALECIWHLRPLYYETKQHLTPLLRSSLQLHLLLLLLTVTQVRYSYGELSCWNEVHCCEVSAWFTVVNNGRCASLAIIHV